MNKNPKKITEQDIPLDDISILREGLSGRFWGILKLHLQENVDWMTDVINGDVVDDEMGKLSPETREELVKWRMKCKELLELPQRMISSMEQGKTEPISLDPYFSTYKELVDSNRNGTRSE